MASWARGLPACCRWLPTVVVVGPEVLREAMLERLRAAAAGEVAMPENVSLAFVRLSSMVAWIAEHPGVTWMI